MLETKNNPTRKRVNLGLLSLKYFIISFYNFRLIPLLVVNLKKSPQFARIGTN